MNGKELIELNIKKENEKIKQSYNYGIDDERERIIGIIKKRIKNCEIKNSPCFVCEELKDLRYEIESKK